MGLPCTTKSWEKNAIFYIETALQKLSINIQGARQLSKPTHSEHLPSCKVHAPRPAVPAVLFLSKHNCCSLTPGSWKQGSHKQFSLFYLDPVISQQSTRQFLCQTQMVHTKYSGESKPLPSWQRVSNASCCHNVEMVSYLARKTFRGCTGQPHINPHKAPRTNSEVPQSLLQSLYLDWIFCSE